MKHLLLMPVIFISLYSYGEEGRLNRESNDYKYTSLGVHVTEAEDSGICYKPLSGSSWIILCGFRTQGRRHRL